jgi:DNA (cytosine-5)-methyltransferase 1
MLIHPWEDRLLTVREGARIQSIPDYIRFVGSLNSQQQQISDCVPSILSYVLAKHIKNNL